MTWNARFKFTEVEQTGSDPDVWTSTAVATEVGSNTEGQLSKITMTFEGPQEPPEVGTEFYAYGSHTAQQAADDDPDSGSEDSSG